MLLQYSTVHQDCFQAAGVVARADVVKISSSSDDASRLLSTWRPHTWW
jgi:hypothetical protein